MDPMIVEVASVSASGVMALPKRVRNALGMKGGGRVVFFADTEHHRAVVMPEAAFQALAQSPSRNLFRHRSASRGSRLNDKDSRPSAI